MIDHINYFLEAFNVRGLQWKRAFFKYKLGGNRSKTNESNSGGSNRPPLAPKSEKIKHPSDYCSLAGQLSYS